MKYLFYCLLSPIILFVLACNDEAIKNIEIPEIEEQVPKYSFISYAEALDKGMPIHDSTRYFEMVHPDGEVTVTLPADGSEVYLELNSMAHLGRVIYYNDKSGWASRKYAPQTASDGYYVWCSSPMIFIFTPYRIDVMDYMTITFLEPTKIGFKYNPNTKNTFYKYWTFGVRATRLSPLLALETFQDLKLHTFCPDVYINIKSER